jgi:acetyl esterase/lipase
MMAEAVSGAVAFNDAKAAGELLQSVDADPTVILAAACDPLADDATRFAERLAAAGVDHVLRHGEGMPHIFHGGWAAMPATAPYVEWLDREIRARL